MMDFGTTTNGSIGNSTSTMVMVSSSSGYYFGRRRQVLIGIAIMLVALGSINGLRSLFFTGRSTSSKDYYFYTASDNDVRNKSTISTSNDHADASAQLSSLDRQRQRQRQQQAMTMLQYMQERGAMNTEVSNRKVILQNSSSSSSSSPSLFDRVFPRQWRPCVMEQLFQHNKKKKVKITVMGGSTAARPGLNCTDNLVTNPHGGRYSNILEQNLREDLVSQQHGADADADANADANNGNNPLLQFEVINMGQGGEISTRGAFFLDRYIDPHETDIIVWDYLLNDDAMPGEGIRDQVQKLDFWLTRVKAHYRQANKPPPPIVLLYLWPFRAGLRLRDNKIKTMDKNPMSYLGKLIDSYRTQFDWDIAVINVGAAVNSKLVKGNTKLLLDDSLHPSCQGAHLIADLLQHSFLNNLASAAGGTAAECHLQQQRHKTIDSTTTMIQTTSSVKHATPPQENPKLWQDLWNENARIGSLSAWEPRILSSNNDNNMIMSHSNIRIGYNATIFAQRLYEAQEQLLHHPNNNNSNSNELLRWPMVSGGKADPTREDRKYGYRIPRCQGGKQPPLSLTFDDPDLKWIGLALVGKVPFQITVDINGSGARMIVPTTKLLQLYASPYLTHWIDLRSMLMKQQQLPQQQPAKDYTLYLCHKASANQLQKENPNLQYLLGVSVPATNNDNDDNSKDGNRTTTATAIATSRGF